MSSKQLRARIRCWGCGRLGHVQKNCPKDGNQYFMFVGWSDESGEHLNFMVGEWETRLSRDDVGNFNEHPFLAVRTLERQIACAVSTTSSSTMRRC